MSYLLLYLLLHIICGLIGAGIYCADLQRSFPTLHEYRYNLGVSLCLGLTFGPIFLFVSFLFSGFAEHGWTLKNLNL